MAYRLKKCLLFSVNLTTYNCYRWRKGKQNTSSFALKCHFRKRHLISMILGRWPTWRTNPLLYIFYQSHPVVLSIQLVRHSFTSYATINITIHTIKCYKFFMATYCKHYEGARSIKIGLMMVPKGDRNM